MQGREHRLQQGESGVAMQQGQQMLRRFLTEGLPPATHMDAEEDDGALVSVRNIFRCTPSGCLLKPPTMHTSLH